jgi:hypothetical protein
MKTLLDGQGKGLKEKNMETGAVHAIKEREQGSPLRPDGRRSKKKILMIPRGLNP